MDQRKDQSSGIARPLVSGKKINATSPRTKITLM
jgi:hypothetical protein